MQSNQYYKNEALAALKGNWPQALVAVVICYFMVLLLCSSNFAPFFGLVIPQPLMLAAGGVVMLFSLFFVYPFIIGMMNSFKSLYADGDGDILNNLFKSGFGKNYLRNVWGYFLMILFVFLWSLLFLIPGLIKSFSYALTPYILEDNPELSANQAINMSRRMMRGHKFDLFYLLLSFLGWYILCIFTLGIGLLWLVPYMYTAVAAFYRDLKLSEERAALGTAGMPSDKVI